jgi:hypothetical protein
MLYGNPPYYIHNSRQQIPSVISLPYILYPKSGQCLCRQETQNIFSSDIEPKLLLLGLSHRPYPQTLFTSSSHMPIESAYFPTARVSLNFRVLRWGGKPCIDLLLPYSKLQADKNIFFSFERSHDLVVHVCGQISLVLMAPLLAIWSANSFPKMFW